MSYARGDFHVKTVRTGLGDLLVIIPPAAERGSSGIIAEGSSGSAMPLWIMVNHGCHNGAHSNGCPAQRTSPFNPLESSGRPACLKKQVGLDFLWKNSGQEWMRSLLAFSTTAPHICLPPVGPQSTQWWRQWSRSSLSHGFHDSPLLLALCQGLCTQTPGRVGCWIWKGISASKRRVVWIIGHCQLC